MKSQVIKRIVETGPRIPDGRNFSALIHFIETFNTAFPLLNLHVTLSSNAE